MGARAAILARPGEPPRMYEVEGEIRAASVEPAGHAVALATADPKGSPAKDLILDLMTFAPVGTGRVCAEGQVSALAYTGDGKRLVAACGSRGLTVASARLAVEKTSPVKWSDRGVFMTGRAELLLGDPDAKVVTVYDAATLEPRGTTFPYADVRVSSADHARLVDVSLAAARVFEVDGLREAWSHVESEKPKPITAIAQGLVRAGELYDVAKHQRIAPYDWTEDGQVSWTIAEDGNSILFTELGAEGKSWTIKALDARFAELSSHGRYLVTQSIDYRTRLGENIWVIHSATTERSIPNKTMSIALGPLEDYVATIEPCEDTSQGPCQFVRLTGFASGGASTLKIDADVDNARPLEFSPSGKQLLVRKAVYDLASRKLLWTLPEGEEFGGFVTGSSIMAVEVGAQKSRPASLRLAEVTTGATKLELPYEWSVGSSFNGAFIVVATDARMAVVNVQSGASTPLPMEAPRERKPVFVTDDGAFVWATVAGRLVVCRVADGRVLQMRGPRVTDEGVLDAAEASAQSARERVAIRKGPSVLRSPMDPATAAPPELVHANLVDDFFAGKPVSPR